MIHIVSTDCIRNFSCCHILLFAMGFRCTCTCTCIVSFDNSLISVYLFSLRENKLADGLSVTDEFDSKLRFQERAAKSFQAPIDEGPIQYSEIECLINGEYTIKCRREGSDVYMPFSFVEKYFDVRLAI